MTVDPRRWPITLKVPVAVAVLMLVAGAVLSERVLDRLGDLQQRHLRDLAQGYLDGLSSAVAPSVLREDVWEVYDAIARAQKLNKGLRPSEAIVTDPRGAVLAASDPRIHPVGSHFAPASSAAFAYESGSTEANAHRELSYPGRTIGHLYATFDTSHLAAERRDVIATLLVTNGILVTLLAAAGWLLVARMMRPVRTLTEHLGASPDGVAPPIADWEIDRSRGEFRRLFKAYNGLSRSIAERDELRKRLADEERSGSLGRLASSLAHEINNPLGGLFNALSTLRTHGHLAAARDGAIGLLDRGLAGIRDVVRTTLAIHRTDGEERGLRPDDIEDLLLLVSAEARRKSVRVTVTEPLSEEVAVPSGPIRQALLNLLLNAIAAAPTGSEVELAAIADMQRAAFEVRDRGAGLPRDAATLLSDPERLPPPGVGLGLWATRRLVADIGGTCETEERPGGGAIVRIVVSLRQDETLADVA
ncbi:HAMP domain-containing sensor histidine kinase [Methylopila sp. M107]|uniref:ATP-binding protein n=1 Tax=Methylopila sp. M107 TaxID=1101190 RepID=UPI00036D4529|nr:HAMP domain-containing sensor histidine kinase [Methylopila sp. M107]